jgi:WD40 repeat protein
VKAGGDLRKNHYTVVEMFPDGRRAVLVRADDEGMDAKPGALEIWDLTRNKLLLSLPVGAPVEDLAICDDVTIVTVSSELKVWQVNGFTSHTKTLSRTDTDMICVSASPDQRFVAVGHSSGWIEIWDIVTANRAAKLYAHEGRVDDVCFASGPHRLVSVGEDQCLKVWDLDRKAVVASFFGDSALTAVATASDGITFLAGEKSGRVHFLRLEP